MKAIILTICILISLYFLHKFSIIYQDMKKMQLIKVNCSDFIIRTSYNKKEYVAFYEYTFKKEDYTASDKSRLPFLKYFIKLNKKYDMYINPNKPNSYVSPYELIVYKYYLILALLFIIVPMLLLK